MTNCATCANRIDGSTATDARVRASAAGRVACTQSRMLTTTPAEGFNLHGLLWLRPDRAYPPLHCDGYIDATPLADGFVEGDYTDEARPDTKSKRAPEPKPTTPYHCNRCNRDFDPRNKAGKVRRECPDAKCRNGAQSGVRVSPSTLTKAQGLWARGITSTRQIADHLGVSHKVARRIINEILKPSGVASGIDTKQQMVTR